MICDRPSTAINYPLTYFYTRWKIVASCFAQNHYIFFLHFQGLSRIRDGLLVAELDLNLNRQVRDYTCFQVCVILKLQFVICN